MADHMTFPLARKVVLITGAGGGLAMRSAEHRAALTTLERSLAVHHP